MLPSAVHHVTWVSHLMVFHLLGLGHHVEAQPCFVVFLVLCVFAIEITFRGALYYSCVMCTSAAVLIDWVECDELVIKLVCVSRSRAAMAHSAYEGCWHAFQRSM